MTISNSSYSFFQAVQKGTVTTLDQVNFIESITDGYDMIKTEALLKDLRNYTLEFLEEIKDKFGMEKLLLDGSRPQYEFQTRNPRNVKLRMVPPEEVYSKELTNISLFKEKIEDAVQKGKSKKIIDKKKSIQKKEYELLESAPEIDLSNSTCTEKIVYLKELGILDYLQKKEPFNMSVRKLALVLVPILGEKYGTIQAVLNPVLNGHVSKNNPYNNTSNKKIEKVRQHLIELEVTVNADKNGTK